MIFFNCKHSSIAFICMSVLSICFLPAFVVSVDVECREHQLYKQRHCYCPKIDKLITAFLLLSSFLAYSNKTSLSEILFTEVKIRQ